MSNLVRIYFFCVFLLIGLHLATQNLAEMLLYNPRLGDPVFISGVAYYYPWKYIEWYRAFYREVPLAFNQTNLYIFGGFLAGLAFLAFTVKKQPPTSHGSAKWGDEHDLRAMDLLSASGVVVGLHDTPLVRFFTKRLRALEQMNRNKVNRAELSYGRRLDKLQMQKILQLEQMEAEKNKATFQPTPAFSKKLETLKKDIEHPRTYDPKMNPCTVYPFVLFYKLYEKFYRKLSHSYLYDNSNKHLAVIAPTRSGKGVGLIIPTLLGSWKESVIVNDIKSENYGITSGYRKRMGHTVIKFEPTATDGSTARWNPLNEIPIGTPEEVSSAQNLAYTLADYEGKGKLDHWGANAAVVITTVILHLKYAHYVDPKNYPNEPSLYDVAAFLKVNTVPMTDEEGNPVYEWVDEMGNTYDEEQPNTIKMQRLEAKMFVDSLANILETFEHVPDEGIFIRKWNTAKETYEHRRFTPDDLKALYPLSTSLNEQPNVHPLLWQNFTELQAKPKSECGSILSTANTALKEYLDPTLAKNTSVSDFAIDDLMNYKKPVSLYLVTPPSDLLRLAPIFRLFFEMMVKHHAKKVEYKNGQAKPLYKHKCLFLMDEFSSLGNLKSFAATLSYIAGYGMKVFLINQGLPQIYDIYGKDNQILMNCHLQIFYAPNDTDTAKYGESLLGSKTITVESVTSTGFLSKKSYSTSETGRALMTADELKRIGEQEIIVASGSPPVLTDKVKYYEDGYFLNRLFPAPIASDIIRNHPYPERDRLLAQANAQAELGQRAIHLKTQWKEL